MGQNKMDENESEAWHETLDPKISWPVSRYELTGVTGNCGVTLVRA